MTRNIDKSTESTDKKPLELKGQIVSGSQATVNSFLMEKSPHKSGLAVLEEKKDEIVSEIGLKMYPENKIDRDYIEFKMQTILDDLKYSVLENNKLYLNKSDMETLFKKDEYFQTTLKGCKSISEFIKNMDISTDTKSVILDHLSYIIVEGSKIEMTNFVINFFKTK